MFLVPNDTVNHFSLGAPCRSTVWEHHVLQVRVPLDRALSVVLLTLLTAQSLSTALAPAPPDSEHLTCLSIPCWSQRGWCLCWCLPVCIWVLVCLLSQRTFLLKPTQPHHSLLNSIYIVSGREMLLGLFIFFVFVLVCTSVCSPG